MDASLASLDHGPLLQLEDLCLEGLIIHSLDGYRVAGTMMGTRDIVKNKTNTALAFNKSIAQRGLCK